MTRIRIDNPVEREFAMVPNAIWSLPCSLKAKAIFAYLLSFRDGSYPSVAAVEAALGIHRDTRQKAMKELEQLGFVKWVIGRNAGRIVTKELCVTTAPLLANHHKPEKPVHGSHKPVLPSDGKTGRVYRKNRSCGPEKPVPYQDKNIKEALAKFSDLEKVDLSALSSWQRRCLGDGTSVKICGVHWVPDTPQFAALVQLLRNEVLA